MTARGEHRPRPEDDEQLVPHAMAGQSDDMVRQEIHGEEERDDEEREHGRA